MGLLNQCMQEYFNLAVFKFASVDINNKYKDLMSKWLYTSSAQDQL